MKRTQSRYILAAPSRRPLRIFATDPMLGRLVTIESFQNAMEARLYQQQLEAVGIRCVIADEHAVSMFWHLSGAIGGIKLHWY